MMGGNELAQLYQDVVVDHNRSPRNFRRIEGCGETDSCRMADGHNPLCGDKLHLYVKLDGDRIEDVAFEGSGCAISIASASLLTEAVQGLTVEEAHRRFGAVHPVLTGTAPADAETLLSLGKVAALAGVSAYPMRVKCATLSWHTLEAALAGNDEVTTE